MRVKSKVQDDGQVLTNHENLIKDFIIASNEKEFMNVALEDCYYDIPQQAYYWELEEEGRQVYYQEEFE